MNKKLIGGIVLGVILVTSVAFILLGRNDKPSVKQVATHVVAEKVIVKYKKNEIVKMFHQMANSLIVAEDKEIWGKLDMNKKNIVKLITKLGNAEDFTEKATLLDIAKDWKNGNFNNIVANHNYVWDMLDGTIGMANGVKEDAVTKAVSNMK